MSRICSNVPDCVKRTLQEYADADHDGNASAAFRCLLEWWECETLEKGDGLTFFGRSPYHHEKERKAALSLKIDEKHLELLDAYRTRHAMSYCKAIASLVFAWQLDNDSTYIDNPTRCMRKNRP